MMLYPKIEDCVDKVGSKFTLAVIVAKRAKDLTAKMAGQEGNEKEISYALKEIFADKVAVKFGAEAHR